MKHKIFKSLIIIAILVSAFQFCYASTNALRVDTSEKVYDFADLFTDDEEEKLYNNIQKYIDKTEIDMIILTIDENNKSSTVAYAEEFYRYNNFGMGNESDGILCIIDMDNRRIEIYASDKGSDIYHSYIDPILDEGYSYLTNGEYYECADKFISSSLNYYNKYTIKGWIIGFAVAIIASLLIPTIFCLVHKAKHKAVKLATNADSYLDKSSFVITNSRDNFVHTHTSRIAKPSSSSSGGSGGSRVSHGGRNF